MAIPNGNSISNISARNNHNDNGANGAPSHPYADVGEKEDCLTDGHNGGTNGGVDVVGLATAVDQVFLSCQKRQGDGKKQVQVGKAGHGASPSHLASSASSSSASFFVTKDDLSKYANDRDKAALARVIQTGMKAVTNHQQQNDDGVHGGDYENPSTMREVTVKVDQLVAQLKDDDKNGPFVENSVEEHVADKNVDAAVNVLCKILLRTTPEKGLSSDEIDARRQYFGTNAIAEKPLISFWKLCFEAVQDFVLLMLIVLAGIALAVEITEPGPCGSCWAEGAAILCTVILVVLLTASIDYVKQFAFRRLTRTLNESNTKQVIRDGKQVTVTDDDIVVGDILSVNSHSLASIPADCILLSPVADLKMDESALTGESDPVAKKPGDVILSGTNAVEGSGRMVVIAVGINSVAGKIQARVYESKDIEDDLDGDSSSPLFVKLDSIAKQIGVVGMVAGTAAFTVSCIIGLAVNGDDRSKIIDYLVTAITVLAVAVPEGLPLAVTLALAFSSNQMTKDQNLVKQLNACETMGCATTICTDKTGTLTANKMCARAMYTAESTTMIDDPKVSLGETLKISIPEKVLGILACAISIDTMNESVLDVDSTTNTVKGSSGNPTEVALLTLVHDMGFNYEQLRNETRGRSSHGKLAEFLGEGKLLGFSSARKMMSWIVPVENGGYRLYCKGAQEVIALRCKSFIGEGGAVKGLDDEASEAFKEQSMVYARRGMRVLALACRDISAGSDVDALSPTITNPDGSKAFEAETNMTLIGLVGIEDPLRPDVPAAIEKCYGAGIDVRMVTGDNPNTAVSIAYQAGILRDFHFVEGTTERVASNLKQHVLLTGDVFRKKVYRCAATDDGTDSKPEFDQAAFDSIWPYLRVLARSSPDDKLTLAHGLNQSTLFANKGAVDQLKSEGITIFEDRQVVAMTGDGTNDAPALKRADIGFAMGISGTQIAKDAADIILLDDNFASIVTAAKWGRNIYASLQKFLQFQLTVNISAVFTALTGAFAYQTSPLAAIQLLWVNVLMDSFASLALASEPPIEELLYKPPVNRTRHMITSHMWANMLGQASYQITIIMILLFDGPRIFDLDPGHVVEDTGENSVHYTLIFNTFVWMQLFNEFNARKLKGEFNVFKGVFSNVIFCSIMLVTSVLQVLIVQYGGKAFHVADGGLSLKYWGISLALGFGSLPVQQIINVVFRISSHSRRRIRQKKRIERDVAKLSHPHRD